MTPRCTQWAGVTLSAAGLLPDRLLCPSGTCHSCSPWKRLLARSTLTELKQERRQVMDGERQHLNVVIKRV